MCLLLVSLSLLLLFRVFYFIVMLCFDSLGYYLNCIFRSLEEIFRYIASPYCSVFLLPDSETRHSPVGFGR